MYSPVVWQHIKDAQHRRVLPKANALGESRYEKCGDHFILQLRIENGTIQEAGFLAKACAPVVAMGSVGTSLLQGLTLEQAFQLTAFQLDASLGGLPSPKRHAILLFLDSLHQAIQTFQANQKGSSHEPKD